MRVSGGDLDDLLASQVHLAWRVAFVVVFRGPSEGSFVVAAKGENLQNKKKEKNPFGFNAICNISMFLSTSRERRAHVSRQNKDHS